MIALELDLLRCNGMLLPMMLVVASSLQRTGTGCTGSYVWSRWHSTHQTIIVVGHIFFLDSVESNRSDLAPMIIKDNGGMARP